MNQPALLEVPQDSPSREERLAAFKTLHGIETLHSPGIPEPWAACHMPSARKFGYGVTETSSLGDCIAKVCRLLEEAEVFVTGETELMALDKLCRANDLTFFHA